MSSKISSDLEYIRDLAEAGEQAPSLSGRFSLLWFGLTAIALMAHWAIARGIIPGVTEPYVGLVWLVYAVLGSTGSYLIGRSIQNLPGQSSAGNRVDRHTWQVAGISIFLFVLGIVAVVSMRPQVSELLFDMIMPAAFLAYAVSYSANAAFTKGFSKWLPVIMSMLSMVAAILFVGTPEVYLASAVGVVAVWSVGGYRQLREEPKPVV